MKGKDSCHEKHAVTEGSCKQSRETAIVKREKPFRQPNTSFQARSPAYSNRQCQKRLCQKYDAGFFNLMFYPYL